MDSMAPQWPLNEKESVVRPLAALSQESTTMAMSTRAICMEQRISLPWFGQSTAFLSKAMALKPWH